MTRLAQMTWQRSESVEETCSLLAYLRPGCGQIHAKANPSFVDTGPPSS